MDQRAVELAEAEFHTRRALNVATKEYNKALVSQWMKEREVSYRMEGNFCGA